MTEQTESCDIKEKSCCCAGSAPEAKVDLKSHWDKAYESSDLNKLGWYEEIPEPSLRLLEKCKLDKEAAILNIGAGTSHFIDELIAQDYRRIIVNDISSVALERLKNRLDPVNLQRLEWICDDLTNPSELTKLEPVDLWHDRAVLHFFQDIKEQDTYFALLKSLVKTGGFAILAEFSLEGADKCSGLPVFRYSDEMLSEKLGNDFNLIESFKFTYQMPTGDDREYVYTLFKRLHP